MVSPWISPASDALELEPVMERVRIALAGDVMIGRGIDQIMGHPGDPVLYEPWARSSLRYVELAEERSGPLPRDVEPSYVWGDTLTRLRDQDVDVRIVNLETAVTARGRPWPDKGIHYRAHPANADCLVAGRIDVASVANNHILDWSEPGLADTLDTLTDLGVDHVGAGDGQDESWAPAQVTSDGRRVVVLGLGTPSSGIPAEWAAGPDRPGVVLLTNLSDNTIETVGEKLQEVRGQEDIVVVSIHWGSNWGYRIPPSHRRFARALIDDVGVDVVHGHSSHHPLEFEVYRDRLILYGCGDLITDYEGISGHEEFRPDLSAWYVVDIGPGGSVRGLKLTPTRLHRFQLTTPGPDDIDWMARHLEDQTTGIGIDVVHDLLEVRW